MPRLEAKSVHQFFDDLFGPKYRRPAPASVLVASAVHVKESGSAYVAYREKLLREAIHGGMRDVAQIDHGNWRKGSWNASGGAFLCTVTVS